MGPAERPSSSPRPDIGEVYADAVLLVWKPVESYGPVTYIVQCSLEGRSPRCLASWAEPSHLCIPLGKGLCTPRLGSGEALDCPSPTSLWPRRQLEHPGFRHL